MQYCILIVLYAVMCMEAQCVMCGKVFSNHYPRKVCFDCKPLPGIDIMTVLRVYREGGSYKFVAQKLDMSEHSVMAVLQKYSKPRLRGVPLADSPVVLNREWVDGWLLGDGGLVVSAGRRNARGQHTSKYLEYTQYVANMWSQMGFAVGKIHRYPFRFKDGGLGNSYCVVSRAHPVLTEIYARWYIQGVKTIPRDLVLTPTLLREWYLGDGCLSDGGPSLELGNVGQEEVDYLFSLLRGKFGSRMSCRCRPDPGVTKLGKIRKPRFTIRLFRELSGSFFSFIGPCTLDCYKYRWPLTVGG